MSKKIGIITYHHTINYGATLQSYGLYNFLINLGYEVELIDYISNEIAWEDRKFLYFSKYNLLHPFTIIKGLNRRTKMNNFLNENLKRSQKRFFHENELKIYSHPYDIIICGSDEIWNIAHRKFDKSYFIDFLNDEKVKKISYAASFGSTNCIDNYKAEISILLKNFSSLSVRDNNSLSLVEQCGTGAKVQKVLDPTFLISHKDYENISKNPDVKNPYILIYGQLSSKEVEYINYIAKKIKLDIVSIGTKQDSLRTITKSNIFDVSPEYWLGFFSQADLIVTKFYHGVIFSIIFNKPFVFFDSPAKSLKVKDLLRTLKLEDRIMDCHKFETDMDKNDENWILTLPLSKQTQKDIIKEQIKSSQDFLFRSLQ